MSSTTIFDCNGWNCHERLSLPTNRNEQDGQLNGWLVRSIQDCVRTVSGHTIGAQAEVLHYCPKCAQSVQPLPHASLKSAIDAAIAARVAPPSDAKPTDALS